MEEIGQIGIGNRVVVRWVGEPCLGGTVRQWRFTGIRKLRLPDILNTGNGGHCVLYLIKHICIAPSCIGKRSPLGEIPDDRKRLSVEHMPKLLTPGSTGFVFGWPSVSKAGYSRPGA